MNAHPPFEHLLAKTLHQEDQETTSTKYMTKGDID